MDNVFSLEFKSNCSYWLNCGYCDKKQCNDCPIPQSDATIEKILEKVKKNDVTAVLEIVIVWNKSPIPKIKPMDIYDYYLKQN
jgi:ubiquitin carboxyl-terminal hydrolase 4/11/15